MKKKKKIQKGREIIKSHSHNLSTCWTVLVFSFHWSFFNIFFLWKWPKLVWKSYRLASSSNHLLVHSRNLRYISKYFSYSLNSKWSNYLFRILFSDYDSLVQFNSAHFGSVWNSLAQIGSFLLNLSEFVWVCLSLTECDWVWLSLAEFC